MGLLHNTAALWRRVTRIGIDPDLPAEEAKYVVMINAAAILAVAIVASYLPLLAPFGPPARPFIIICLVQLPVWSLPLWFNYRRRHLAAKNYLAMGCLGFFTWQVYLFGPVYGHQYFLLLLAVGPFLSYPQRHRFFMWLWFSLGLLCYFLVASLAHRFEPWFQPVPMPEILVPLAAVPVKVGVFGALAMLAFYSRRVTLAAEEQVRINLDKSEELLLNILPRPIADRLKAGEQPIADGFDDVTVLFADIVGFTVLAGERPPAEVVSILNRLFTEFDALADRHGLEKIKTIGDAYMVAGGLPEPRKDHAEAVATMALEMVATVAAAAAEGLPVAIRVGIHSGPVVAGVIGRRKFSYDLWGDTVNTASRMESHGVPGEVHISRATRDRIAELCTTEARGEIDVKGKGRMETFFLRPS